MDHRNWSILKMKHKTSFYTQFTKFFYKTRTEFLFVIKQSCNQWFNVTNIIIWWQKITNQTFLNQKSGDFIQNDFIMKKNYNSIIFDIWIKNLENRTYTLKLNIFPSKWHRKLKFGFIELYAILNSILEGQSIWSNHLWDIQDQSVV